MRNNLFLIIFLLTFSIMGCEKHTIDIDESQLTNKQLMHQLDIDDASIWNTLATQSITVEESAESNGLKAAEGFQEWPKGDNYYYALYEDLYPSEGDYDFNDVMLQSKLYLSKSGNIHKGYVSTRLHNKGGSLPVEIGLMFYEVSGNKYRRVPFENITVNEKPLEGKPWTASLTEMGSEWEIEFEFELVSNNIWISYFIQVNEVEIMTGGFAPSTVEFFEVPYPTYLTSKNLPWGLEIETDEFAIPNEKELFLNCYPEFQEWAESGGVKNKKWYQSPDPKYTHD